jgi:capsular exopolysaccharide synthesis family protein
MSQASQDDGASALRGFMSVLWRRRWGVLATLLLVPLVAVAFSLLQEERYEATADVLLQRGSVAATVTGASDANVGVPVERIIGTRAELARLPDVATRALDAAGVAGATPQQLLANSSVEALGETDILTFGVRDANPVQAARLATAYATEFTAYLRELDQAALNDARVQVQRRLRAVEALRPFRTSQLRQRFVALTRRARELETLQAIQTPSAVVVRPAQSAEKVQPRPVRSAVLGLGFGLLLGIGVALLWEALDSRVRSSDQIEARLGMPLLARLGAPRRRARDGLAPVTLRHPGSVEAEAFRLLRANLAFAIASSSARTIMVTSAVEGEGKSTTAANLAVALARTGKRVILADLDLRRPTIDRFFDLEDGPGLMDVVHGDIHLDEAVARIPVTAAAVPDAADANGSSGWAATLEVLPLGEPPSNPGELIDGDALGEILNRLNEWAEIVLIDSPPLLGTGDTVALSTKVDALLIVTRANFLSNPTLVELRRVLASCPAAKLGFVLTDADRDEGSSGRYGPSAYFKSAPRRTPAKVRDGDSDPA